MIFSRDPRSFETFFFFFFSMWQESVLLRSMTIPRSTFWLSETRPAFPHSQERASFLKAGFARNSPRVPQIIRWTGILRLWKGIKISVTHCKVSARDSKRNASAEILFRTASSLRDSFDSRGNRLSVRPRPGDTANRRATGKSNERRSHARS